MDRVATTPEVSAAPDDPWWSRPYGQRDPLGDAVICRIRVRTKAGSLADARICRQLAYW